MKKSFFDIFNIPDIPEHICTSLQNAVVKGITHRKQENVLEIDILTPYIVDSSILFEMETLIALHVLKDPTFKIRILPEFVKIPSMTPIELFESYRDNILWELEHRGGNISVLSLLKEATVESDENGHLLFTVYNAFLADICGAEMVNYIRELLLKRFRVDTAPSFKMCDDPHVLSEIRQKQEEQLQQIQTVSIPSHPAGLPHQQESREPRLIYGKNTEGKITKIEDIHNFFEGQVVVQGCILSCEERKTRREDTWLLILGLTDYSDSITAKVFLKEKQLEGLRPFLQENTFVTVKGIVGFDDFSKEQTIRITGISKSEAWLTKRKDTASTKRVELHCHTKMSEMDGVSDVRNLVKTAYDWGMPAVAITDHGVAYAFPDANHEREDLWEAHEKQCEKDGTAPGEYKDFFKVIYGIEGYLVNDVDGAEVDLPIEKQKTYHIIILAKNETGRVNLYKLISRSHLDYFHKRPRIPKSLLAEYRDGLIIGSACEAGEIFRAITRGESKDTIRVLAQFYDYLEIQPIGNNHFMILNDTDYPDIQLEEDLQNLNRQIVRLGEELQKPVVATCDVHFLNPEDEVYRRIILSSMKYKDVDNQAPLYFRTTEEMLEEFSYLGSEKAEEVVITNSNKIAEQIEAISPVRPDNCPPVIENSDTTLREICAKRAHELYGETLPAIVEERMNKELDAIISNGYAVMYIIAQKLVWKSVADGYLVGSRGSVGSSLAAFLAGITEVNSLPPHYRCEGCFYVDFDSNDVKQYAGGAGCDMPDKVCPRCGKPLIKDGFDIPFETFLGFEGDKEPDIDLNFSGKYQAHAHQYTAEIFGKGQTFKAGTISGVADKNAYRYAREYLEARNQSPRKCEAERLASGCIDVRKSSGQHPGGIVVLPQGEDIYTFTPIQYPANDKTKGVITTHFDYHSIDHNLLKLDELGHDDPTMIRELQDLTGLDPTTIPLDDKRVMSLFTSPKELGLTPDDIFGWRVGSLGIPEFGTGFVEKMLIEANPTQFSDLIRIAGLGHGEDVWLGNAQELIRSGQCTISTAICCRDDIMVYLINKGMAPKTAFNIMEAVRKGKVAKGECGAWDTWKDEMKAHGVPDWYIGSCERIAYMFPKAHAAAYVMMAWRIAYCKLYYPLEYYTAYFTVRADDFSYEDMCQGKEFLEQRMREMLTREDMLTDKERNKLKDMRIVQEMYARDFSFEPLDLCRASATKFKIVDGKIMPSLTAIDGLGEKNACGIEAAYRENDVLSIVDLQQKAHIGDSAIALLNQFDLLAGLPMSNQLSFFEEG